MGLWHVDAVEVSSRGQLWVGVRSAGLYVTDDEVCFDFVGFEKGNPLYGSNSYMVKSIDGDDKGLIWVGFESGVFMVAESKEGGFELVNASIVFESSDLEVVLDQMGFRALSIIFYIDSLID